MPTPAEQEGNPNDDLKWKPNDLRGNRKCFLNVSRGPNFFSMLYYKTYNLNKQTLG